MSIVPLPSDDYPDYQREWNQDGPTLYDQRYVTQGGTVSIGPFDVSRYRALAIFDASYQQDIQLRIGWDTTEAGYGLPYVIWDIYGSQFSNYTSRIIANRGPWATLRWEPLPLVSNWTQVSTVALTNRYAGVPTLPDSGFPLLLSGGAIAANSTAYYYPGACEGYVNAYSNMPASGAIAYIEACNPGSPAVPCDAWSLPVGPSGSIRLAPPPAWRIRIDTNANAQPSFDLTIATPGA